MTEVSLATFPFINEEIGYSERLTDYVTRILKWRRDFEAKQRKELERLVEYNKGINDYTTESVIEFIRELLGVSG